jgi:hypothetical protein
MSASSSEHCIDTSLEDRATISHELALQRLNVNLDACLPDDWRRSALNGETVGLSHMTPLGISCSWYTNQAEWFDIANSLHQRQSTEMFHLLCSLVANIFQEENQLTKELLGNFNGPLLDVCAAFQPISDIRPSKRIPDGRIRRAHMLNCLVDKLLWASHPSSTTASPPVQLPHYRFPEDDLFSDYVDLMQTWHKVVWNSCQSLEFEQVELAPSDNVSLSLFKSVLSSSNGRRLHTMIENFSRCALAVRAMACVS